MIVKQLNSDHSGMIRKQFSVIVGNNVDFIGIIGKHILFGKLFLEDTFHSCHFLKEQKQNVSVMTTFFQ